MFVFSPVFTATDLIFPYAIHKFNIAKEFPTVWKTIKISYCISSYISILLIVNSILSFRKKSPKKILKKKKSSTSNIKNQLNLFVGTNSLTQEKIYLPEKSLYQNILITGTIGSRKN